MKAIILAAGKGTRMQPLTLSMSKGMIPVANKPILNWTIDALAFCDQIILVINHAQSDIIAAFEHNPKIAFIYQDEPLGTGHALLQAEPMLTGEDFLVAYGDDIYGPGDMKKIAHLTGTVLSCYESDHPENFGVLDVRDGLVRGLEEKPREPRSRLVSCGLYHFDSHIFPALHQLTPSPRGEYELTDAIKLLISSGAPVHAERIEIWIPLSYPWNILDANKYLLDRVGSQIDPTAIIRSGAVIEHPVSIGAGAIVGPNCFIRSYASIGPGCKIGQAVEIKNSIIMDNTYVSHLSYVGDTIVGRNCNVGGGTIFANLRLDEKNVKIEINGSRIDSGRKKLGGIAGDNVKFGTRVTIMPGKRIWPGLMIPACMMVDEDIKTELPLGRYAHNNKHKKIHEFVEEDNKEEDE